MIVIGDGLAQGFGEWITLGMTNGIVRRAPVLSAQDERIRTRWVFIERYVYRYELIAVCRCVGR